MKSVSREILRVARDILAGCSVRLDDGSARERVEREIEKMADFYYEDYEDIHAPYDRKREEALLEKALANIDDDLRESTESVAVAMLDEVEKADTTADYKAVAQKITFAASKMMKEIKATGRYSPVHVVTFLHDLDDKVMNLAGIGDDKDPEEASREYEEEMWSRYRQGVGDGFKRLGKLLKQFCGKLGYGFGFKLRPNLPSEVGIDAFENMSFHVGFDRGMAPDFTVFADGAGYDVDDVLSWGDRDFFDDPVEQKAYFELVEYLRTGRLPKRGGYIKLYRGMSTDEYAKWERGQKIPAGKFFTSRRSSALAQDVSGKFPELFTFTVSQDIVTETDPGTFQLTQSGRLKGKKIEPY